MRLLLIRDTHGNLGIEFLHRVEATIESPEKVAGHVALVLGLHAIVH